MSNVKEIINKYIRDKSIKKYANKYFFKDNTKFREIKTNEDVDNTIRGIEYFINYYKEIYPLHREDIIVMEKALGEYEIAVEKVLKFYGRLDFKYSADELLQLINNISNYENEIKEIHLRKMCQD